MDLFGLPNRVLYHVFQRLSNEDLKNMFLALQKTVLRRVVGRVIRKRYLRAIHHLKDDQIFSEPLADDIELDIFISDLLRIFTREGFLICCCGGYPSHLFGKTSEFTDIDLFVNSDVSAADAFELVRVKFDAQFEVKIRSSSELPYYYYDEAGIKINHLISVFGPFGDYQEIQFIFVSLNLCEKFGPEFFTFEVLDSFDLNLCKTGIVFHPPTKLRPQGLMCGINLGIPTKTYLWDRVSDAHRQKRVEKYQARDLVPALNPFSLKSLSMSTALKVGARFTQIDHERGSQRFR